MPKYQRDTSYTTGTADTTPIDGRLGTDFAWAASGLSAWNLVQVVNFGTVDLYVGINQTPTASRGEQPIPPKGSAYYNVTDVDAIYLMASTGTCAFAARRIKEYQ